MDDLRSMQKRGAGDWEAFRYLVEKYQSRAVGHALAIVGNREDALDAVQEMFLDAFQALGRFDEERPFYPWLYAILRNRCVKLLASRKRLKAISLEHPGSQGKESEFNTTTCHTKSGCRWNRLFSRRRLMTGS